MAKWALHIEQNESQVWDDTAEAPTAEAAARTVAHRLYPWAEWDPPVLRIVDPHGGTICRIVTQPA